MPVTGIEKYEFRAYQLALTAECYLTLVTPGPSVHVPIKFGEKSVIGLSGVPTADSDE